MSGAMITRMPTLNRRKCYEKSTPPPPLIFIFSTLQIIYIVLNQYFGKLVARKNTIMRDFRGPSTQKMPRFHTKNAKIWVSLPPKRPFLNRNSGHLNRPPRTHFLRRDSRKNVKPRLPQTDKR